MGGRRAKGAMLARLAALGSSAISTGPPILAALRSAWAASSNTPPTNTPSDPQLSLAFPRYCWPTTEFWCSTGLPI